MKREKKPLSPDVDAIVVPWKRPAESNPDGKNQPANQGRVRIVYARETDSSPRSLRRRLHARSDEAPPFEEERGSPGPPPRPESQTPPSPGAKPDDGKPDGRPAADRPDLLATLPTGGQPRYFSPAPLKKVETPPGAPAPLPDSDEPGHGKTPDGLTVKRADFAPAATAPLDDNVPETGVADPSSLGSYHVQISAGPEFRRVLFNKVYGFMADIDINGDLAAAGMKPGIYWIRWSLVDLLEFEHPFTRPQRMRLEGPFGP